MVRLGWFLLRHHRLNMAVHRLAHRFVPKDQACLVCTAVWRALESQPGFNEALDQGEADIRAGRFVRWDLG